MKEVVRLVLTFFIVALLVQGFLKQIVEGFSCLSCFKLELKIKKVVQLVRLILWRKKKLQNLPKYLVSLIIFASHVYAFWLGMQLTPYMLNLRVANRLGSNKIQCSLAYKFLFMLQWLRHDVLLSIVIPGRLIWWWCKVLPDPRALSAKRCHLLPDL